MDSNDFTKEPDGTLILEHTAVNGSIHSERSIYLKGKVKGDIRCNSRLMICKGAVVEGEVFCKELCVDGLIRGNAEVEGMAYLSANAVMEGHLLASALLIHPEAEIGGGIRLKG